MPYAARLLLTSLALALLAPACTNNTKCGDHERGCVDSDDSLTATTGVPTGFATEPTTTQATEPTTGGTGTTAETTGDPTELLRCKPTCTVDSDCLIDAMDIGFTCVAGECGLPPCLDDLGCQRTLSGWSEPCTSDRECFMGEACIAVGNEGLCATQPGRAFACADLGLVEIVMPAVAGGDVTVCGNIDATCTAGACVSPCKTDADCPVERGTPHCQADTGQCTCASDDECQTTGQPGFTVCLAGTCGCSSDADCAGGTNVDTCVAGSCGCSTNATCTDPIFDHVTPICGA